MKSSLQKYTGEVDEIFADKKSKKDIDKVIENHLIKINFFQHERLIHLIVTVTFAIIAILIFLYSINNFSIGIFILQILFIALLIPYVFHYYFLENNVQKLYEQYDKLKELGDSKGGERGN